jgi:hypothetical protein
MGTMEAELRVLIRYDSIEAKGGKDGQSRQ